VAYDGEYGSGVRWSDCLVVQSSFWFLFVLLLVAKNNNSTRRCDVGCVSVSQSTLKQTRVSHASVSVSDSCRRT